MSKRKLTSACRIAVAGLCLALALPLTAADTGQINYQARLLDAYGRRVTGTVDLSFKMYNGSDTLLWSEEQPGVAVQDGVYSVMLGAQTPIPAAIFAQGDVYLELGINGETMSPRQLISGAAYSLVARSVAGSNLFENQSSGNIGIGTTSPASKLDVNGTIQSTGFKMTTGASAGYVMVCDADGVGTWQPISVVIVEVDPVHTNWVKNTYAPDTNALWAGINAAVPNSGGEMTGPLTNNAGFYGNGAGLTNLSVTLTNFVERTGDVMTGYLTNLVGFVGNGAGLTNISAEGVSLTGVVHKTGDVMTGMLIVSNNVKVSLTNEAGYVVATNSITLGGVEIRSWNSVGGGDLTNDLHVLQASTGSLNAALSGSTNYIIAQQTATNEVFEAQLTNKVNKTGDTMSGELRLSGTGGTGGFLSFGDGTFDIYPNAGNSQLIFKMGAVERGMFANGRWGGTGYLSSGLTTFTDFNDQDTGIGFDSANGLALMTGGSNRLFVASNGRVGIGIGAAAPGESLQVNGNILLDAAGNLPQIYAGSASGGYLKLGNAMNFWGHLELGTGPGGTSDASGPYISFSTSASERMRIVMSGNVGLGTTLPLAKLHVNGSAIIETNLTVALTNQAGDVVATNSISLRGSVITNWAQLGGGGGNNIIKTGSGSISYSNLYYLAGDGSWDPANASAVATAQGLVAIALGSNVETDGLLLSGFCTNMWGASFTPGAILYMGTNNCEITTTRPTGTNHVVRILGYAVSTTNIYFDPDRSYIEILGD